MPVAVSPPLDLELSPPYRAVRRLGAGAAGEVYLVENQREGRLEAMKVLKPVRPPDAALIAQGRFLREAHAAQRLTHASMVATYESGRLPDGRLFLTMEYVAGPTLHALVQQRGPLPIALTLGIFAEVADALFHAHRAGVIHRDIKPHNLVLAPHPHGAVVRVLDFGMAKMLGAEQPGAALTALGAVFGTPEYMSPEQTRGRPADLRSDLYALGCVCFELLVGEPPFRGTIATLFAAHALRAPRTPSSIDPDAAIPPELDAVILRCLEKRVEDRFQTGAELCAAIQAVPGYRPLRTPPRS